jgi:hypothetical protein
MMRTDQQLVHDRPIAVGAPLNGSLLRTAEVLSWIVVALMAVSGVVTPFVDDLLAAETPWGREAFRGGELVSLVIAVPLLAGALIAVRAGSVRAQPLWIGVLLYAAYDYAYAAFGATFNDAFLVHIGAFGASVFALACALPVLDLTRIATAFRPVRAAQGVGIFLVIVGAAQGALWLFVVGRNALTGEVLHDIPVSGQHLVFALDLALLVPSLIVGGVMLARRRPFGYLFGTAMAIMGAVYQLNLLMAGVFGAAADVAGVKALAPEGLFLTAAFAAAASAMLLGGRRR